MVSVVVSSAVDPGVNHGSGQRKDYKNFICFFSAMQRGVDSESG